MKARAVAYYMVAIQPYGSPTSPSVMHMTARVLQAGAVLAALVLIVNAPSRGPEPLAAARLADPTFSDVAPVFYRNCTSCHRSGGLAPFSLIEYDSASAYLAEMKEAVAQNKMPPWHADAPRGVFSNDRRLEPSERDLILKWLATGAQEGDKAKLPPKPVYPSSWNIGTPDLVVTMPTEYTVPAMGTVEYQYFEIPTNLTEEKWVQALEVLPGAHKVVHHVLVYARVPPPPRDPNAPPAAAAQPQPGATPPAPLFVRNRAHGTPPDAPRKDSANMRRNPLGALIGSMAPGTTIQEFPAGTALRLRPGTIITLQMHYTAHGEAMKDRTSIGFRFAKEMPAEEMFTSNFVNGSFTIPAGAKDYEVPSELGFGQPVKIWGMLPHTHLRGTRWQYTLVKPDSSKEVILDVPKYDFNWQTFYMYAKPLELAPGSKILATAWYDNSAGNKSNPNPKAEVKWGDQTWEEMQYTGILFTRPDRRLRP